MPGRLPRDDKFLKYLSVFPFVPFNRRRRRPQNATSVSRRPGECVNPDAYRRMTNTSSPMLALSVSPDDRDKRKCRRDERSLHGGGLARRATVASFLPILHFFGVCIYKNIYIYICMKHPLLNSEYNNSTPCYRGWKLLQKKGGP